MRRVILQEFVSLDGLAAGAKGDVGFVPASTKADRSFGRHQSRLIESVDAILLGRVTYQMFAGYWPGVKSGKEKAFADKLNATPKIVFSKTLHRAPWGDWEECKIVKTNAASEVSKLRRRKGKDMVIWGSLSLAQALMNEGLIDEHQLVVCPVVLGEGRPLFEKVDSLKMNLIQTKSFDLGAVLLDYEGASRRAHRSRKTTR